MLSDFKHITTVFVFLPCFALFTFFYKKNEAQKAPFLCFYICSSLSLTEAKSVHPLFRKRSINVFAESVLIEK